MNTASVYLHDSVESAPKWSEQIRVETVEVAEFHVVRKGTAEGLSTVDIVLMDKDGIRYIAMTTGRIIRSLAKLIGEEE